MTTLARARRRTVRAAAPPLADEGIVTAIVAVTGHEDSVQDIIIPGSFEATLKRIRPKLCWHHDWKDPLGRVLHIVEVRPGDKRLPTVLPDGRAWPKEAGALIATMQFNLRTQRGREMFEHCKEWAKTGEAAFSIGYRVVDGMASKRADGVRLIYALDLFEVSLVLHGAHNMALALEVKELGRPGVEIKDSPTGIMEVKAAEPMIGAGAMVALYLDPTVANQIVQPDGNPAEELHVTLAFLGDGSVADSMIGDQGAIDRMVNELKDHIAGSGVITGSIGGIGVFPPSAADGPTPVWVPVDVPGLTELRQAVVAGCEAAGFPQNSEHGYTPHVTLGYDLPSLEPVASTPVAFDQVFLVVGGQRVPIPLGSSSAPMEGKAHSALVEALAFATGLEGKGGVPGVADTPSDHAAVQRLRESWTDGTMAAKIGWGTGGDFARCVALATEHMGPEDAKGWCNLRHHDALGFYPATHAAMEGKALPKKQKCKYGDEPATKRIIHAEGRAYIPVCDKHLKKGKAAAERTTPDGKPDPSNIDAIRPIEGKSALDAVLEAKNMRTPREKDPQEGQETKMMPRMRGSLEERREALQVALDSLFRKDEPKGPEPMAPSDCWVNVEATFDTYVIASVTERNDTQAYRVDYTVDPDGDGDEVTLGKPVKVELDVVAVPDDDSEPAKVEEGEAVALRFIDPASGFLADATRRINAMPEGKSLGALEEPLLRLMDALAVKGFDVAGAVMGDEPAPDDEEDDGADGIPEADEHDGDADDAEESDPAEAEHDGDEDDEETVSIDPEAVKAELAALHA